ncbi:MAG: hypothetical protein M0R70_03135 [Nitrospirae bacterium]|nr:hypothetical protein [Nitrospirota bacterium]
MYFNSAEILINAFNIINNPLYDRIIPLKDCKAGFSIQKKYPEDIRYKPPKLRNGDDDTVTLTHVIYEHPEEDKKQQAQGSRVPLVVRIVRFSRYTATHFDYNFSDENCPTKESVEKSKLTPAPIELNYENAFYYDHGDSRFHEVTTGQALTGVEILERVYKDHCDTVHLIKGLKLRLKLRSQSFGIFILNIFVSILTKTLTSLFGRTLDDSDSISIYFSGYKRENLKKLSTESIAVFGYNTARRVIILFCLLVSTSFTWYFLAGVHSKYLKAVFSNSFLSLVFSILIIWTLDVIVPLLLFHMINVGIKLRSTLMLKTFKGF